MALSAFGPLWSGSASAENLEQQLAKVAPKVLQALHARSHKSCGVLKFLVQVADRPVTDSAGTFNSLIADRLETALLLANPPAGAEAIDIVHQASAEAAKLPGANHCSPAGRSRLFTGRYPLAWGKKQIPVDAFVTGVARVDLGLRTVSLGIILFGAHDAGFHNIETITAETDGLVLNEIGESFHLRGMGSDADPAEAALQVRKDPARAFPLLDRPAVTLRIFYDAEPVDLAYQDGMALIPEPRPAQRVTLRLERLDRSAERLGVVLKVNGENTLYRQQLPDLECNRWILDPGDPPIEILGYQVKDRDLAEQFHVLTRAESKRLEMHYGHEVGLISAVVFRERRAASAAAETDDPDLEAIMRAAFPLQPAASLEELQDGIRRATGAGKPRGAPLPPSHDAKPRGGNTPDGGLIVPGKPVAYRVQTVAFQPDPLPIMSAVIRYYRPQTPAAPAPGGSVK